MAVNMCARNCSEDTTAFLLQMMPSDFSWDELSYQFDYNPWFCSFLGSTMVGLAGILPLLVIPIDEGADLKNGANAGTLRMLLSFAVGGLLGDVFLHVLPEAWENDLLKKAESTDGLRIPCGLWVLNGFLVFLILEKIFSFTSNSNMENSGKTVNTNGTDENSLSDSTKSEARKLLENNNCITLIDAKEKNGFIRGYKVGEALNDQAIESFFSKKERKNGYVGVANNVTEMRKNGFVKSLAVYKEHPNGMLIKGNNNNINVNYNNNNNNNNNSEVKNSSKKLLRSNNDVSKKLLSSNSSNCLEQNKLTQASKIVVEKRPATKDKGGRQIAGYLNLMANCFDNFSHGLSVGASFMMSFRLGAFTTFAILMHEIPHEVGDFAILLRSGFSRWDAARAQLFTACGGLFGAMTAILFAGGSVQAKTNWILPFTAGNFLHIGLVTILPELLKESSPKESLKQLGALLFGISLMAALSILGD